MSSSDYAIRIKGIGKQYRLGLEQSAGVYQYKSLGDTVASAVRSPLKTLRSTVLQPPLDESNSFWALKDVNFDVKKGEVVGIIGRNGAGKSTLLKVLSRITRPTTGEIELHGRVGSLLEVGTGFHPELSGRENIYLNGAVLGMTRAEVKRRFDEIVAFSEIEKFLDTPVKQYSSGMYTRLAFAVAAHLEPEILVVDEVLAVGDAEFQRKCLGKMKDVASTGRTVLFVSHNIAAIRALCDRGIVLRSGNISFVGDASEATAAYQRSATLSADRPTFTPMRSLSTGVNLLNCTVDQSTSGLRHDINLCFEFLLEKPVPRFGVGIEVTDDDGVRLCKMHPGHPGPELGAQKGHLNVEVVIGDAAWSLAAGTYRVNVTVHEVHNSTLFRGENVAHFEIPEFDLYGVGWPFRIIDCGPVPLRITMLARPLSNADSTVCPSR